MTQQTNPLNILITGCGAPGIKGTVYSLRNNFDERPVNLIGTDMQDEVVGKYLCDDFYTIPRASDATAYIDRLSNICSDRKIQVIVPQNTAELLVLASNKNKFHSLGTSIVVSDESAVETANNKFKLMKTCSRLDIPVSRFHLVDSMDDLVDCAEQLGWPNEKVVVKPPISNGQRGLRIIDEAVDQKKSFYQDKPTSLYARMEDLRRILGNTFPGLIVTEYLPGLEYTVDVLRTETSFVAIPRTRDLIRSGITFAGTTEFNEEIIGYSKKMSEEINLKYCFGFQFKMDKTGVPTILECNPRVQGTMVMSTFASANLIYAAVKTALGEDIPEFHINWGTKMLRYWGGVSVFDNRSISELS